MPRILYSSDRDQTTVQAIPKLPFRPCIGQEKHPYPGRYSPFGPPRDLPNVFPQSCNSFKTVGVTRREDNAAGVVRLGQLIAPQIHLVPSPAWVDAQNHTGRVFDLGSKGGAVASYAARPCWRPLSEAVTWIFSRLEASRRPHGGAPQAVSSGQAPVQTGQNRLGTYREASASDYAFHVIRRVQQHIGCRFAFFVGPTRPQLAFGQMPCRVPMGQKASE